ncbi:hypothetical protein CDAR_312491 [Caerostris darwini]|uniref:Uncharacterized protein n=1 Tax=Caerostris darwini TaxID=1538125 RepID=A0AAV4N463_9ARAC|nr:hypothetical protein CDAR_312491 [Caerostris darwini]
MTAIRLIASERCEMTDNKSDSFAFFHFRCSEMARLFPFRHFRRFIETADAIFRAHLFSLPTELRMNGPDQKRI